MHDAGLIDSFLAARDGDREGSGTDISLGKREGKKYTYHHRNRIEKMQT